MEPSITIRKSRPRRHATEIRPTHYGQWNCETVPSGEPREPSVQILDPSDHPATRMSFQVANNGRLIVNESDIDFVNDDDDGVVVVPRSQKGKIAPNSAPMKDRKVGLDKKILGEVRLLLNGQGRAFRDNKDPTWYKGEYHWRMRSRFIDEAEHDQEPYAVPPAAGHAADDITSRSSIQSNWDDNNPWSLLDPHGVFVIPTTYRGPWRQKKIPDWKLEDGTVVIDLYGHPVRMFRDVPSTLSSELKPAFVEGLRQLTDIKMNDLRARMPKNPQNEEGQYLNLVGPSAITNRSIGWREEHGFEASKTGRPPKKHSEKSKGKQSGKRPVGDLSSDEEEDSQPHPTKKAKKGDKRPGNNRGKMAAQDTTRGTKKGARKNPKRGAQAQEGRTSRTSVHPEADSSGLMPPKHPAQALDSFGTGREPSGSLSQGHSPDLRDSIDPEVLSGNTDPFPLSTSSGQSVDWDQWVQQPAKSNVPDEPSEIGSGDEDQSGDDVLTSQYDQPRSEYAPPPDPNAPGPGPYHMK